MKDVLKLFFSILLLIVALIPWVLIFAVLIIVFG